jgi:hypothetical protein
MQVSTRVARGGHQPCPKEAVVRALAWVVVGTLIGATSACGGDDDGGGGSPPTIPGETELDLHDDVTPLDEPTYENVAKLLRGDPAVANDRGLCAYSGCHSGPGKGGLTFRGSGTLDEMQVYAALVEGANGHVQACEYHPLRRVEPGDPSKSWLYIKLAGETDDRDQMNLVAAVDWDESMSPCEDTFPGSLMPFAEDEPVIPLEPEELRMVAEWILDGAPGPVAP